MGLPSKRRTKQQKRERSSHFALASKGLTTCSHCKRKILPHRVCQYCGYYRGRQVIKMKTGLEKRSKKTAKPEAEAKAEAAAAKADKK
ncbi:MAG: 50S ribosomal protein L32 [Candidatus Kerfeldbacteria bacterium]|nr:50S ribosomal protein L32 [Candidatus Kerfeldbacteria bacterium]